MGLSEEHRARVREIELIRIEVWEEARSKITEKRSERMSSMFANGSPAGTCLGCDRELRTRWRYCPFCSYPARTTCLFCSGQLPDEEGIRFCPNCGNKVG